MKQYLKWTPAAPIRKQDNIISSKVRETNDFGFKPSYESQPKEYMNFLMSNEYAKIWFKERAVYEKDTYSRAETIKEDNKLKRRYVQRMMTYRKPTKLEMLSETYPKYESRVTKENKEGDKYIRWRYKPTCKSKKVAKNDQRQETINQQSKGGGKEKFTEATADVGQKVKQKVNASGKPKDEIKVNADERKKIEGNVTLDDKQKVGEKNCEIVIPCECDVIC